MRSRVQNGIVEFRLPGKAKLDLSPDQLNQLIRRAGIGAGKSKILCPGKDMDLSGVASGSGGGELIIKQAEIDAGVMCKTCGWRRADRPEIRF